MGVKRIGSILTSIVCVSSVTLGGVVMVPSAVARGGDGEVTITETTMAKHAPVDLSDYGYKHNYSKEEVNKILSDYKAVYEKLWNGEDDRFKSDGGIKIDQATKDVTEEVKGIIDKLNSGPVEGEEYSSDFLTKFKKDDGSYDEEKFNVAMQFALALELSYQNSPFFKRGNYKNHRLTQVGFGGAPADSDSFVGKLEDKNSNNDIIVPMAVLKKAISDKDSYKYGVMPEELIKDSLKKGDDRRARWESYNGGGSRDEHEHWFIINFWQQAAWLTAVKLNPNLVNSEIGKFDGVDLTNNKADNRAYAIQVWKENMAKGTEPSLINTHFKKQIGGNYEFSDKGKQLIADIDVLLEDPMASDQAKDTLKNTRDVVTGLKEKINDNEINLEDLGLEITGVKEATDEATTAPDEEATDEATAPDKESTEATTAPETTTTSPDEESTEATTTAPETTTTTPETTTAPDEESTETTTAPETTTTTPDEESTETTTAPEDVVGDDSQSDGNNLDLSELLDFDETDKEALATVGSVWRTDTNAGWLLRNKISNKMDTIVATSKNGDTIEILSFVTILRENGKMVAKATDDSSEASWSVVKFNDEDKPLLLSYNSVLMGEFVS